jgi:hypothetical protein
MSWVQRRIAADERRVFESINAVLLPVLVSAALTCIAWMLLPPMWAGVVTAWFGLRLRCLQGVSRAGAAAVRSPRCMRSR